jgi:polysaccharide pyruvyl transferase WcaK-like protein
MINGLLSGVKSFYFLTPGAYFGDIGLFDFLFVMLKVLVLKTIGIKICQVGVSYERIGPWHSKLIKYRSLFLHRHLVRDTASAAYARSIGARVDGIAPDLAFGTPDQYTSVKTKRSWLAISFRLDQSPVDVENLIEEFIGVLDRELPVHIGFKFISQVSRDAASLKQLRASIQTRKTEFVDVSHNISDCRAAYLDCCYVVGNRLHSLLIGSLSGAAPLAVIDRLSNAKIAYLFEDMQAARFIFDIRQNAGYDVSACIKNNLTPVINSDAQGVRLRELFSEIFGDET